MSGGIHEWPTKLEIEGQTSTVFEGVLEPGLPISDGWSVQHDTLYISPAGNLYIYDPSTGAIR